ncbi:MAG: cytidylate kinase-like family protein [Oscillospiraceae bacterium]|nr:cytidylate kinase-like family protein [Oscillospiraceae bacterium]
MAKKIITITRQYGSGGREIGERLAKELALEFYDNRLLEIAAKDSGIHKNHFEENDEKRTNSFLYLLSTTYGQGGIPFDDTLFFAQLNAIQKVASEHACVIIGRCADYALRDFTGVINLFISAPFETRVKRAIEVYGIEEKHAADYVKRIDKQRTSYYNYYTDKRWGQPQNYQLCLDSSTLGIDGSVKLIKDFIKMYYND